MKPRILIVDDDTYTLALLQGLFRNMPVDVQIAQDGAEARGKFRQSDFNLILMDQRLPDVNGLDLLRELRVERPRQVAILITGYADVRDAVCAVREGLFDYLTKPFENLDELEAVIEKALELDRAYREIDDLRENLDAKAGCPVMIGRSPAFETLLQQIKQVAPLDASVLLEGESGTGKELAARMIHCQSGRADKRFLDVNCGALSEQLLESTLFGFEKGAFTGAVKNTPGVLEEADGGTLFLDEITDMSAHLQSSLLRVLQEHTFSRLGSTAQRTSDFRLVCATNRQLIGEVQAGRFREDLFYRINVIDLHIPPLRERRDDITPLALYFLAHFNGTFDKEIGPPTPEAIDIMERYVWPGNVRQLKHTVEKIIALKSSGSIDAADLAHLAGNQGANEMIGGAVEPYRREKEKFERDYLLRVLEAAGGNISEAARLSGLARQNLYTRMNRFGIVMEKKPAASK